MGEKHFSRELRLLTPTHFSTVFSDAIPSVSPQLTLLAKNTSQSTPRLGITIAKKRVKHAHERNRLKRIIRESFRLTRHNLPNVDIVVVAKSGIDTMSNEDVFRLLEKLWKKLANRCRS